MTLLKGCPACGGDEVRKAIERMGVRARKPREYLNGREPNVRCPVCKRAWVLEPISMSGLLRDCRQWLQSALEELTLRPTASTAPSLVEGEELIGLIDCALRDNMRDVHRDGRDLHKRLQEVESALAVVGQALSSLDTMVAAAQAIEAGRK